MKKKLDEVKNVKRQAKTHQIDDYLAISEQHGLTFTLQVRPSTRITKPLQKLIDEGKIILDRSLPDP